MKLIALGGTDYVGASCYFLHMEGVNLLLDCGTDFRRTKRLLPDFDFLLRSGELSSLSQLDAVLLSHGHSDHAGALPDLLSMADMRVYASQLTVALLDNLLLERPLPYLKDETLFKRFGRESAQLTALQHIRTVPFRSSFQLGPLQITFFEAGHVPGAAMIYIEGQHETFLYTGDFSCHDTRLTQGAYLPPFVKPQTVLMCGLHAKHPRYSPYSALSGIERAVRLCEAHGEPLYIRAPQATKGLELAHHVADVCPDIPVYLERDIWELTDKLCGQHLPAQRPQFYPESCWSGQSNRPSVHIGGTQGSRRFRHVIEGNFSLHADYPDCVALMRRLHPATVLVVHAPADRDGRYDQQLRADLAPVDVIYPELDTPYCIEYTK
ncbi:MAG: MBL fold metallo-hydrolase [Clostridia bacterium]|nr:MBL fold metallo-hydrolase [Clostridia bacterium]